MTPGCILPSELLLFKMNCSLLIHIQQGGCRTRPPAGLSSPPCGLWGAVTVAGSLTVVGRGLLCTLGWSLSVLVTPFCCGQCFVSVSLQHTHFLLSTRGFWLLLHKRPEETLAS